MFYDIFEQLCKEKGVTVSRAALDMGLSKSAPIAWRKKGAAPSGDTLNKLADYFNVTVDYLLTGDEQEKKPLTQDEELLELLDYYKNRPELKILFSVTKNAKPESIRRAAAIVEALEKDERNED